ncbi:hypothetical protein JHK84_032301 [Glycine max]|nr:hypothetical protein JHK84_032301 [Glycine max]
MLLDRFPRMDNLNKRGIILQGEEALCSFCKEANETLEHSLFKCKFAIDVWNACYRWLGLFSAMHKKPIQHFMIHDCSWLGSHKNKVWKSVWGATVWALWCHRNNLIFGEQSLDLDSVVETIKFKSWLWLESYVKAFHFSFFEWFSNPMSSLQSL